MKIYKNSITASVSDIVASDKITLDMLYGMEFDEALAYASDYIQDLTTRDALANYAKECIDRERYSVAIHIINALWDSGDYDYFLYDYSAGTLSTPTEVTSISDLEGYF